MRGQLDIVKRLAMIIEQNLEALMPELNQVSAWPPLGQRRDDLGTAVDRRLSDDFFNSYVEG